MQWETTTQKMNTAESQIAWSLWPYFYSTSNGPCLCSTYTTMSSSWKNAALTPTNDSGKNKTSERKQENPQHSENTSISKILKFGIERILNDKSALKCSGSAGW